VSAPSGRVGYAELPASGGVRMVVQGTRVAPTGGSSRFHEFPRIPEKIVAIVLDRISKFW